MSHDVPDYVPDMNHDGDIDSRDAALFYEMLDEDQKEESVQRTQSCFRNSEPWTIHHSIAKGALLFFFGLIPALVFNGVLPINGVTAVLTLLSSVCFLRTLLL